MAEEQDVEYKKSPDYATVHADGILLQMGRDDSRLIFYQETLEPTDDKKAIDKSTRHMKLMFEVRIPHPPLQRFANATIQIFNALETTFNAVKDSKDAKVTNKYFKYREIIQSSLYDSRSYRAEFDPEDKAKLQNYFQDWVLRLLKEKGIPPEEVEKAFRELGFL